MTTKQHLLAFWQSKNIPEEILQAFTIIPRELFVLPQYQHQAYSDMPLPTLRNQSISQPTTIMMMLQALEPKPGDHILEVGAGVGYQAALLSSIVGKNGTITTLEVIPELVTTAKQNVAALNINNIAIFEADGSVGFPEHAPYDKIIITAACPSIPIPIIKQLKENGTIIAPVGDLKSQMLVKGTKIKEKLELEFLGSFVFVPLRGKYGFKESGYYV